MLNDRGCDLPSWHQDRCQNVVFNVLTAPATAQDQGELQLVQSVLVRRLGEAPI